MQCPYTAHIAKFGLVGDSQAKLFDRKETVKFLLLLDVFFAMQCMVTEKIPWIVCTYAADLEKALAEIANDILFASIPSL